MEFGTQELELLREGYWAETQVGTAVGGSWRHTTANQRQDPSHYPATRIDSGIRRVNSRATVFGYGAIWTEVPGGGAVQEP